MVCPHVGEGLHAPPLHACTPGGTVEWGKQQRVDVLVVPCRLCEEEGGGVHAHAHCVLTVQKPHWKHKAKTKRNARGQEREPTG